MGFFDTSTRYFTFLGNFRVRVVHCLTWNVALLSSDGAWAVGWNSSLTSSCCKSKQGHTQSGDPALRVLRGWMPVGLTSRRPAVSR